MTFASTSLLPDLMRKNGNLCPPKRLYTFMPPVPAELKRFARMLQRQSRSFLPGCMVPHLMRICGTQVCVGSQIV
jgi:hypothetical protein